MAKAKKIGQCALCAEMSSVTREHVPPKNLFLAPRPPNTITVPVCEPCNHRYHLDDEYFRVYVAAGAKPGTRHWRLWKEKVVGSSFARGDGLRGRLNNDHGHVLEHHKTQPLLTFENEVVPDELLPLAQPFKASRINAVVEKIIRCLHFSRTGAPLPLAATVDVSVAPLCEPDLRLLHEQRTGSVGHHDEFVFRCEPRDRDGSRWLLMFYGYHTFDVHIHAS
jgi:hypothetical protein